MKYLVSLLGLFLLTSANAQDAKGWGINAGVGVSKIRDRDSDGTFEGNAFGYLVNFEYRFSSHFALGFGGFSLGTADDVVNTVDTELDVDGFDLFGRFILPLSGNTDIYGRLGTATYFVEGNPAVFAGLFGEDALEIGAGIDFAKSENLAFRLEGLFFNGTRDETGGLLTLGASYRF